MGLNMIDTKWHVIPLRRKRLSCSESLYTEGDSSPPLGARRRFSALMDTHRFALPLEGDAETQLQQSTANTTAASSPSASEHSTSVKEAPGVNVGGEGKC